jgi:hypothetical protein
LVVATLWVMGYGTDAALAHRVWGALWRKWRGIG